MPPRLADLYQFSIAWLDELDEDLPTPPPDEPHHPQLGLTAADTFHHVEVGYPFRHPYEERNGDLFLHLQAGNSRNRYRAEPLIRHPAVIAHSGNESMEENAMYMRNPAPLDFGNEAHRSEWLNFPRSSCDYANLDHDMRYFQRFAGRTHLVISTSVKDTEDPTRDATVHIARSTWMFLKIRGRKFTSYHEYKIPLHNFRTALMNAETGLLLSPWAQLVLEAVSRRTDRAERLFQCMLRRRGLEDESLTTWLPPRIDDMDGPLKDAVTVVDPTPLDVEQCCPVCTVDFSDMDPSKIVATSCPGKHVLCWDCLQTWCTALGHEGASCPICRAKILSEEVRHRIVFGLNDDGEYDHDPRFTVYENWERSCADISVQLAENNSESFKVDSNLLWAIWNKLIEGAKLEDENSSPIWTQPVRQGHLKSVSMAVEGYLARSHGYEVVTKDFFRRLIRFVMKQLHFDLNNGPLGDYAGINLRSSLNEPTHVLPNQILPPGFKAFFFRTVNRMLEFRRLRDCSCGTHGFHMHGTREFFCDDMPDPPEQPGTMPHLLRPLEDNHFYYLLAVSGGTFFER